MQKTEVKVLGANSRRDESKIFEWLCHWRIWICLCILVQNVLREGVFHKVHSYQHHASKEIPSCNFYMMMLGLLPQLEQITLYGFVILLSCMLGHKALTTPSCRKGFRIAGVLQFLSKPLSLAAGQQRMTLE